MRSDVAKEITRYGLDTMIMLRGWVNRNDMLAYLSASRALVLSSRAENVPSVIQEALVQERPVVSTNVGGIAELVQDGITGWLVPPDSVEALANALYRVLTTEPAALSQMGKKGRRYILENFDARAQAKHLVALWNSVPPEGN